MLIIGLLCFHKDLMGASKQTTDVSTFVGATKQAITSFASIFSVVLEPDRHPEEWLGHPHNFSYRMSILALCGFHRVVAGATTDSFTIPLSLLCYSLMDVQKDEWASQAIGCLLLGFVVVTKVLARATKQATFFLVTPFSCCARVSKTG